MTQQKLAAPLQGHLNFQGPFKPSFDNFIPANNQIVIQHLQNIDINSYDWVYLSGKPGFGKTHLLMALFFRSIMLKQPVHYVNLIKPDAAYFLQNWHPDCLLLADNLQAMLGQADNEEILFHLLNRIEQSALPLLLAGDKDLPELLIKLPDLGSRLSRFTSYALERLPDDHLNLFIRAYLIRNQINIEDDLLTYLKDRASRKQSTLIKQLDKILYQTQLSGKLSKPIIRTVLTQTHI